MGLPRHPTDQPLKFSPDEPCVVPGEHGTFNARMMTNGIPRETVFLQSAAGFDQGLRKYSYTYWKYTTALDTKRIDGLPQVEGLAESANEHLALPHNTYIGTVYKNGDDMIAPHHDKMRDIHEDSWIVVWRLGAPRLWELYDEDGKAVAALDVRAGDAIFMNARGNSYVKHGVPRQPEAGLSGSIVGRCSKIVVPWPTVFKKAGYEADTPPEGVEA